MAAILLDKEVDWNYILKTQEKYMNQKEISLTNKNSL